MISRRTVRIVTCSTIVALIAIFCGHGLTQAAVQAGIPVFSMRQMDLDGDGRPDVTVIDGAFATQLDRIYAYGQGIDVEAGTNEIPTGSFDDGTWVFDAGADGTAQLIIKFATESGMHVAYLYDDMTGDGNVSYKVVGSEVDITESRYWHVKVTADGAWTLPDGRVNPELSILVDGPILRFLNWGEAAPAGRWVTGNLTTDGEVDWELEIVDQNGDGLADYQLERLKTLIPDWASVFRSTLYVNEDPQAPAPYADTIIWPLLTGSHAYESYGYFQRPPVIAVDWQQAKIDRVGIMGYPTERGYHINSVASAWQKGRVNYANFENPMAYYDLANDDDGYPDLFVRFEQIGPDGLLLLGKHFTEPMIEVEYAWDQDSDQKWDYQIGVGGWQAITGTVQFRDFAVQVMPYEIIPRWVTTRQWGAALFLAAEGAAYRNSEGMSEWTVNRGRVDGEMLEPSTLRNDYLTGQTDVRPLAEYSEIRAGFRGEYAFDLRRQPSLYFSPVDRRLHLLYAEGGVWTTLEQNQLRLGKLDDGPYINQWQYFEGQRLGRQLNVLQDYLIYSDPISQMVQLKRVRAVPPLFETFPPRDHTEWLALGQNLDKYKRDFAPDDFASMIAQFNGPTTEVQGATIRDLRSTPQGFRFALELQPGFSMPLDQENLAPLLGAPGSYVVEYDSDAWSVRPTTPASLRVSGLRVNTQGGTPKTLRWVTVETFVRNDGLEDMHDLPVCATLDGPAGRQVVMTDTVALLPGEAQQRVVWDWAPPAAGSWHVQIAAYCSAAEGTASGGELLAETMVQVADADKPSALWLVSLGGRVSQSIVLFLLATVALAGVAATVWTRRSGL